MAFSGQVLDNPISGERFIFSDTAADTGGELLAVEFVVAPETLRFSLGHSTTQADVGAATGEVVERARRATSR